MAERQPLQEEGSLALIEVFIQKFIMLIFFCLGDKTKLVPKGAKDYLKGDTVNTAKGKKSFFEAKC